MGSQQIPVPFCPAIGYSALPSVGAISAAVVNNLGGGLQLSWRDRGLLGQLPMGEAVCEPSRQD